MKSCSLMMMVVFALAWGSGCRTTDTGPRETAKPAETKQAAPAEGEKMAEEKQKAAALIVEPTLWDSVEDVEAACKERLAQANTLIEKVLQAKGKRDKSNTLVPYNEILLQVDRVLPQAELIANVHPKKEVRTAAEKCEQRVKKFITALTLNRNLYDALKGVESKALDKAAARFLKHLLRDYRRAGVDKDEATRKTLAALDAEMVKLGQEFRRNITEDKRHIMVKEQDLAGLPKDFLKSHKKDKTGKIKITTDYPDFLPVVAYAKKEKVRRDLYQKFLSRAYPKNEAVLKSLLAKRYTYATTLGYPDWAQYMAEDKMAKNKKVISDFILKVRELARPRVKSDLKEILARKKKDNRKVKSVGTWDRYYYVKKIQAERYGVDPAEVRSYFEFTRTKEGLMKLTQDLFGVTFKRAPGAKVWHESVEAYDVLDNNKPIARFYLDLHPREGKYGHAAEFPILSGIEGVQLPAASLVTNFPDPSKTGGEPALTEHTQVKTFFHEFGHLIHHLLSGRHRWVTQSGITCEWDFVEAPSQILEEWTWDHQVLARFAKHHKTGKPIPAALVDRMRKAKEFGKGVHVMRQMFYATLSFTLHDKDPKGLEPMAVVKDLYKKVSPYSYQKGTAVFANFGHLQGYSSMYYTYMWSLVLAKDMFTRFKKEGLLNKETARAYRDAVLAPGGSRDAAQMVKDFLGREHSFAAYEEWLKE